MPGDRIFVDTNVWIYAHLRAPDDPRHPVALHSVLSASDLVISPQVVAEYYSVMLRHDRLDAWIQDNLQAMFNLTRLQPADASVVERALLLRNRYGFSFWDCQIAAAALISQCSTLWSEDLQHGQVLDEQLTVINPFHELKPQP